MEISFLAVARPVIVIAYLIAAIQVVVYALRPGVIRFRIFWWSVAAILLFLGLNKQFDWLSNFTALGRALTLEQGWYDARQTVQFPYILAVLCVGILGLGLLAWFMRRVLKQYWPALLGLVLLAVLVLLRTSSFHFFDALFYKPIAGIPINWFLEFTAIVLIVIPTMTAQRAGTFTNRES